MKNPRRYVARAIGGTGWRVWDRLRKRWWGNVFTTHPGALVDQLNIDKSAQKVVELSRSSKPAAVPAAQPRRTTVEPKLRRRGGA